MPSPHAVILCKSVHYGNTAKIARMMAAAAAAGSADGAALDAAPRLVDGDAVPELGDPAERRTKLRATAPNLLRLHRLSLSPYGDGVSGDAVLREAPPRG
jgi:hypothetical protein